MARVDLAILHEIVRVIQSRAKVPERVRLLKRDYQITYLEDHRQRIEEAIRRHDTDRLNMLFGQLASKVKYQLLRRAPTREKGRPTARVTRGKATARGTRGKARTVRAARGRTSTTTKRKRARAR